jgi:hypothetical protein
MKSGEILVGYWRYDDGQSIDLGMSKPPSPYRPKNIKKEDIEKVENLYSYGDVQEGQPNDS